MACQLDVRYYLAQREVRPQVPTEALSHDSTVKVGLVVVLLGLAGTAGAAHYRLGKAEQDIAEVKAMAVDTARETTRASQAHELRLQRIDDKLEVMSLTLTEIWDVLKRQDPRRQR